jgi:hypothetical protein
MKLFGRDWSSTELIGILTLLATGICAIGAWFVVPEFRHLFGLIPREEFSAHPSPQPSQNPSPQAAATTSRVDSLPSSLPPSPPDATLHVPSRKPPVLLEVTVVFYNDTSDPTFSVDDQPTRPTGYTSGIAKFHLPGGTHVIRAEYSTRTCSATLALPLSEPGPVPASCSLKRAGGA